MKFGGTSVGDASSLTKVLEIVQDSQSDHAVLVVVSAMAGKTDLLIEAAVRSAEGDSQAVSSIFASIRETHESAARALLPSSVERKHFEDTMQGCLAEGERACQETTLAGELTPKARDFISSLGERLCAPLVAAALIECGVASEAVDARDCLVTDSHHG